MGHGDTSAHGAPSRRARSATTTHAAHVGARSSWYASSWASSTTAAASRGTGAKAAARVPTATQPPDRAPCPVVGEQRRSPPPPPAVGAPRRRRRCRPGTSTSAPASSPARRRRRAASKTTGHGSLPGPEPDHRGAAVEPGRPGRCAVDGRARAGHGLSRRGAAGTERTASGDDAVRRNVDTGPAQRHAAHVATSSTAGGGPQPRTAEMGATPRPGPAPRRPRRPSPPPAAAPGRCGPGCPRAPGRPARSGTV